MIWGLVQQVCAVTFWKNWHIFIVVVQGHLGVRTEVGQVCMSFICMAAGRGMDRLHACFKSWLVVDVLRRQGVSDLHELSEATMLIEVLASKATERYNFSIDKLGHAWAPFLGALPSN